MLSRILRAPVPVVLPAYSLQLRQFSTFNLNNEDEKPARKRRPMSPEDAKQEAAKVAMQGVKDIGSMFSGSSDNDESTKPIDLAPIFAQPSQFASLSLFHQGQICDELQALYEKKWTRMTPQQKRLGYYIAYGNYDVREKFDNWNDPESPPYDLPFTLPSKIKTTAPKNKTPVHKLPPVDLSMTDVRKEQFATGKMDGVSRFFIYLTILILMVAIYRDKSIGEAGKPQPADVMDPFYERLQKEEQERKDAEDKKAAQKSRKWYWLYLK